MFCRIVSFSRVAVCLAFLASVSASHAFPGYGTLMPTDRACATCHVNPNGGGPRNAFGSQFGSLFFFDRTWANLCALDADQDGFTNGQEFGDPDCDWRIGDPVPVWVSDPNDADDRPEAPTNDGFAMGGAEATGGIPSVVRDDPPSDDVSESGEESGRALPSGRSSVIPRPMAGGGSSEAEPADQDEADVAMDSDSVPSPIIPEADDTDMTADAEDTADTENTADVGGMKADRAAPSPSAPPRSTGEQSELIPVVGGASSTGENTTGTAPISTLQEPEFLADESESNAQGGCSAAAHDPVSSISLFLLLIGLLGQRLRRLHESRRTRIAQ